MPSSYFIDRSQQLVRSRAWGVLTELESHEHYRRLKMDPAFLPSFRQLCDLREVTELEASTTHLRDLAAQQVFASGSQRAFVAPTDLYFGLARMLQTFCDLEGSRIGVFRTMAEAEEWLELPTEKSDPSPPRDTR